MTFISELAHAGGEVLSEDKGRSVGECKKTGGHEAFSFKGRRDDCFYVTASLKFRSDSFAM
jgi:hypothetical protein